jgi:hypothetical protein
MGLPHLSFKERKMVELKVGQIWKTAEGEIVLIREQWNDNEDHFQGDNGLIYRQFLNDGNRYFTFSCMSEEPSDLVSLEVEAE